MVFTPEYEPAQKLSVNRSEVVARLKAIAKRHGADFIDYSDHPICKDRTLFYNSQHLNRIGGRTVFHSPGKTTEEIATQNTSSGQ